MVEIPDDVSPSKRERRLATWLASRRQSRADKCGQNLPAAKISPPSHSSINVDAVMWDKISTSSARIFELVNTIHQKVSVSEHKSKAFGGKQMIIVGDFLQLQPIPNLFDNGWFSFQSRIFSAAICQRLQLSKILRQDRADPRFVSALQ